MIIPPKFRLRTNWRGKLIIQIEETRNHMEDLGGSGYYDEYQTKRWRDANVADLHTDFCEPRP